MKKATTIAATTIEAKTKEIVKKHGADKSSLIAVLQDIQEQFNYLPKDALATVNEEMEIPASRIYEVATFYNSFSLNPRGRYLIEVCAGTACHVQGASRLMDKLKRDLEIECGETTKDNMFSLEEVRCLGCCSLAPVVRIGGDIHPYLTQDKIPKILGNYRKQG
jgi:NADH-quinone oxidoreductase subunit E